MNRVQLQDEYILRLIEVNDETKTLVYHHHLEVQLASWKEGVFDATGYMFNGDEYYNDLVIAGDMKERPMCCGIFLDWITLQVSRARDSILNEPVR